MAAILLFLHSRNPDSESLLEQHPAVFRLKQLSLIEIPSMMFVVAGSPYELFRITEIGEAFLERYWSKFEGMSHDVQEEMINRIAGKRWRFVTNHGI